jgi:hypothetical protein
MNEPKMMIKLVIFLFYLSWYIIMVATKNPPVSIVISSRQLSRLHAGKNVRIKAENIGHPNGYVFMVLHPTNYAKLVRAKNSGNSTKITFSENELAGAGLLDVLKGIAGPIMDIATPFVTAYNPALAPAMTVGRQLVRGATGNGVKRNGGRLVKGSPEAKAYMQKLRMMRKGGSRSMPEGEGFKDVLKKAGQYAKTGYKFAKEKGLLTRGADWLEQQAGTRYPKYKDEASFVRGQVRKRLGFGLNQGMPLFQHGQGIVPAGYRGV